jgi:uncharacterized protein YegL
MWDWMVGCWLWARTELFRSVDYNVAWAWLVDTWRVWLFGFVCFAGAWFNHTFGPVPASGFRRAFHKGCAAMVNFFFALFGLLLLVSVTAPMWGPPTFTPTVRTANNRDYTGFSSQDNTPGRRRPGEAMAQTPTTGRTWPFLGADDSKVELSASLTAKNFILVFDGSGSMADRKCSGWRSKMDVAKSAVTEWFKSVPKDANIGLVTFHRGGRKSYPLVSAKESGRLLQVIQEAQPGGDTPLDWAVASAYDMLTAQGKKQLGYGEYFVVVLTDGLATNPKRLETVVKQLLGESPIIIHTIGFCIEGNHTLNQPKRTVYRNANDPEQLRRGLQEVLAEEEKF